MRPQRKLWITAAVATATVAGVLTVQGLEDSSGQGGDPVDAKAEPVETDVHRAALKRSGDGRSATLGQRKTDPFSMLGVTWTDPDTKVEGTIEVRTRAAASGAWTPWVPVDTEAESRNESGQRSGLRGASEPRWVGASDGVEVRVAAADSARAGLPEGLRLDMIDPGEGAGDRASVNTAGRAVEDKAAGGPAAEAGSSADRAAAGVSASEGHNEDTSRADEDTATTALTAMEPAAFTVAGESEGQVSTEGPSAPVAEPSTPAVPSEAMPSTLEPTPAQSTPSTPAPGTSEPGSSAPSPSSDPSTPPTATPTSPASPSQTASPTPSVPSSPGTPTSSGPTAPPVPPSTAPKPPITSRVGWQADESLSNEGPEYNPDVKAVFVHHTAQTSNYSCVDSPKIMRGLHTYHVQSEGWKDLGYNFVVDKCGTVFEGRKGGTDLPVLGAHTYGFNRESAGIAVIGSYDTAAAPSAALTSVARVAAWKLGQYKADPTGTVKLKAGANGGNFKGVKFTSGSSYTFDRISGHRDGFNTICPGGQLYGQLPTIRSYAGGTVGGLAIKSVAGAGKSGATYYAKDAVTVAWTATTPSAFVKGYELLVDGRVVATASGTAGSAKATLPVGTRKVQVRATHISGRTTVTSATSVTVEKTVPTFSTKPKLALRSGTVNTAAVPVTLSWKAADTAALKEVRLTAPTAKTYGPTTTSASHTAKSGSATTWAMTAHDQAGNTASASVSGTPVILQETSAKKTGTWSTKSSSSYLGGKSSSSTAKNASLTWTFTGRSAALVVSRAATSGQVDVFVDGRLAKTVDLKSSTTKYRDAIWTQSWSSSTKHTVKIVVKGTSGRPAITTDGLVYLK
ncbi:N-acetylmuramoyl-L-alanine amidase [Streptomyces uncialis]|uniref:peptidoglycan recognition protein family protein n=1 Tax=Streptomyces uncialis TaxID=1048205 RepID=UPI003F4D6299